MLSKNRLILITIGVLLSLFLASMEGTVIATAMPTIVAQLGGLSIYSWVFSIYMLASTTTVPLYGKLSDVYGRKRVYTFSMVFFMLGSILCAQARSMEQLILFRAIQGLGAGGVLPMAFTIVGEVFTLEQRANMQGVFSGVWGVSAVIGPLIGGFLVDQVSWHWVFYINVIPGILAVTFVWFAWRGIEHRHPEQISIDFAGAALLTLAVLGLLMGLNEMGSALAWLFLALAALFLVGLYLVERRAPDPILPLSLFRDRLFTVTILHGVLAGWAMFGSLNYVPLFVQAVLGTTATQAGITLTPMSLSWTLASIFGARLLMKIGYRTVTWMGMVLLTIGAFLMTRIGVHTSQLQIMANLAMMGLGMGLCIPAFLIAVQSKVRREELGVATSTIQFSRSIGGAVGVSVLGAFLSSGLSNRLLSAGINPSTVSLESLLDPLASASASLSGPIREALAISIANLFIIALVVAALGLAVVFFAPSGTVAQLERQPLPEEYPDI